MKNLNALGRKRTIPNLRVTPGDNVLLHSLTHYCGKPKKSCIRVTAEAKKKEKRNEVLPARPQGPRCKTNLSGEEQESLPE